MKLIIGLVIAAVVLGSVAVPVAMKMRPGGEEGERVRIDAVERGNLSEVVSAPGIIQPKSNIKIAARVSARIVEIPFREGQRVTKGDPTANPPVPPSVLIRLDSTDLEAQLRAVEARKSAQQAQIKVAESQLQSQEAQVRARKAELDDAERDLARQEKLFESKDVSQVAVEAAQTRVDQLSAQYASSQRMIDSERNGLEVLRYQVAAAEADIARARDSLSYTTIVAPIDGVVTKVNSEVGELVVVGTMNNQGTVIMEVANLDTMIVNTRVDEGTVAAIKVGQSATIRSQAYKNQEFKGRVTAVALALTEEARENLKYYKTEVTLEAPGQQIVSGLTADVDIETELHSDVLKVPSQAVLGRNREELPPDVRNLPEVDQARSLATVVYRFVEGKAVATPVKIGASDVTHTIIEAGLKEGELIVAGPYKVLETLKHEQKLRDEAATTQPTDVKK
ncbi:MAG TPA: efflux RND transporter periplasmic adaptor subunit [Tepidisphaeraceae bacterium]|nr:efflux RND transporter periplasmic adaptor subunit [Tepidisphaeraceae bacterium]